MGIILDAIVRLGEYKGDQDRPDHAVRLVVVKTTPHEKRGGPVSNGLLLIATNLLDLPAWIIPLIYRYRWTSEIFHEKLPLATHLPNGIVMGYTAENQQTAACRQS
jgi:hypothetical protein